MEQQMDQSAVAMASNPIEYITQEEEMDTVQNDDEKDATVSTPAHQKVFACELLIMSIFDNLWMSELFPLRLVNAQWNQFATNALLKELHGIRFGPCYNAKNKFGKNGSDRWSLESLMEILSTSTGFPCSKFGFVGGNLKFYEAQRVFTSYGWLISGLKISFRYDDISDKRVAAESLTDSRTIGRILSVHLPNLEELELDFHFQGRYQWPGYQQLLFPPEEEREAQEEQGKQVQLRRLKKLTYSSHLPIRGDDALLRQLLTAAINLEQFHTESNNSYFDMRYLTDLVQTGKVGCISGVKVEMEDEELANWKLEELAHHGPKLSSLNLYSLSLANSGRPGHAPGFLKRVSFILNQLFMSSRKSLDSLNDSGSLGFLPQLELPILENVRVLFLSAPNPNPKPNPKSISISISQLQLSGNSNSILPRGATFSRNFPRLHSLFLELEVKSNADANDEDHDVDLGLVDATTWWTRCFPIDETVPTLRTLSICFWACPPFWLEKFGGMFPNLEQLSIDDVKNFPSLAKILWTGFKKLRKLVLHLDLTFPANFHPDLDAAFTGLDPETCKQLASLSPSELESKCKLGSAAVAENYMRNEPSLLNLTRLEDLDIYLNLHSTDSNYKYPPILTHVTGILVFRPLNSLQQVDISVGRLGKCFWGVQKSVIMETFKSLAPYKVQVQTDFMCR